MSRAVFSIESSASTDRGFVATTGQALTVQLEDPRVSSAVFELVSTTGAALTIPNSGVLSPLSGTMEITLPATDFDSFLLRCTVTYMDGPRLVTEANERLIVVQPNAQRRKIVPSETTQFSLESWPRVVNDLGDFASSMTPGATTVIPDVVSLSTSVKRGVRPALTRFRVQEITMDPGEFDGEVKTMELEGDVFTRTRYLNPNGTTSAIVGSGRAKLQLTWDATAARWNTSAPLDWTKLVRPEDFGPDVGIGDSAADTAAFASMLAAIEVALAGYSDPEAAGLVVEMSAPNYYLEDQIVFPFRWGWGGYEIRGASSSPGGSRVGGVTLNYVGAPAVIARRVTVTFNRAARTAVLSTGTWAGLGFAVGMRLFPQGTASNNRMTKPIATLVGATATFEAPVEATVSGFSTTGMNPSDEVAVVCTVVEFKPFITLRSAWTAYVHDLKIWNATAYPGGVGLCSHGLWVGIESDVSGWESSSGVVLERVDVWGGFNAEGCAALLIGRAPSNPVLGQQCDNIEVVRCFAFGIPVQTAQSIDVSGDTIYTLATATHTAVTWTRATTTATVTHTAHGLLTGAIVNVTVTSDAAAIVLGQKTITVTGANTYTFGCLNAGAASGTLTVVPSAAHTFIDHQPVVPYFTTGGLMADGLDCKVYYARDVVQGAGTLKLSLTPGGAAVTATTSGGLTMLIRPAYMVNAVYQADGNNTKGIRFHHSKFSSCWSCYECPGGFEGLIFDTCSMDTTDSYAVKSESDIRLVSINAERIAKLARAGSGRVIADHCVINAISLDDGWDGIWADTTKFDDSTYHDARTALNVYAIDTATDTISVTSVGGFPPVNGRRVKFSTNKGHMGLPTSLSIDSEEADNDFYIRDVAFISGANYSFKLGLTIGGAAINLTSNGALGIGGVMNLSSELVIQCSSLSLTGSVDVNRSILMESSSLRIGAGNTAANSIPTRPSLAVYQTSFAELEGRKNRGGPQGYLQRIPDLSTEALKRQAHVSYQPYGLQRAASDSLDEMLFEANFDRWNKEAFSPHMFIRFSPRVQVESLWAEVIADSNGVTGWAGTGLTAMRCSMGVYNGGVSDLTALPEFDCMAYSAKTITVSSWVGGVATYTAAAHKISAGDIVTVAGVTPSGYNATGRALATAATWTRVTTTATVTSVAHGYTTGETVDVLISSSLGAITLGAKTITVTSADVFTFTCLDAGATSGTLSMINQTVFKLQIDADPGGVGTVFGTVTVSANSRRRGMEPETRGALLKALPWRPVDLATPANHWTLGNPASALTLSFTLVGAAMTALTAGRLRLGIKLGRFSR